MTCFRSQQRYLIVLRLRLQRRWQKGAALQGPPWRWGQPTKGSDTQKRGSSSACPLRSDTSRLDYLRRSTRERFLQLLAEFLFRALAGLFLFALEDSCRGRKLFTHPRQPQRNSFGVFLCRGAQWMVLSAQLSSDTADPPWRKSISSPSESILIRSPSLNSPSRIFTARGS